MLKENEYQAVIDEVKKTLSEKKVSLLDAIAIMLAIATETSVAAYSLAPHEYHYIQSLWDEIQKNLPVVPNENNQGAGIA